MVVGRTRTLFSGSAPTPLLTNMLVVAFSFEVVEVIESSTDAMEQHVGMLSEGPAVEWNKTYGGTAEDEARDLVETSGRG